MASFNNISEEECYPGYNFTVEETLSYLYTPFGKYFIIVLVPLISTFGIIGNGTFLYAMYHHANATMMRTTTNFYLANLAIADALLLITGAVQYLWNFTHAEGLNFEGTTLSYNYPAGCSLLNIVTNLCYFASVFLVTFVTGERYFAICHPLSYRVSTTRAVAMILVSWTSATTFAGFQVPYYDVRTVCVSWPSDEEQYLGRQDKIPVCFHACEWCQDVATRAFFFQYIISVTAVIFMSLAMIHKLRRRFLRRNSIRHENSVRNHVNLVRMVQINSLVFFLCHTPNEIINTNAIASTHASGFLTSQQMYYITWIGRLTVLVNSAVNPLIYSVVNPAYRKAFHRIYCCHFCRHHQKGKVTISVPPRDIEKELTMKTDLPSPPPCFRRRDDDVINS